MFFNKSSNNLPYEKVGKEVRCIADEIPFELPDSWEWVRASSLGTMVRGKGIKRDETVSIGKACIRYGEIYTTYNDVFKETKSFITEELDAQCLHISFGDVVFTLTGENKVDIAKAIAFLGEGNVAAGGDLAYWTEHGMNPLYLVYYMASPFCIDQKRNVATGDIIVHISTGKVGNFLVPVPPLAEQKRIVEKIEELLPHIEKYGKTESKVSKLNAEFPEQLKKSILQWAIQGKLVPQNPEDEPASVLLERIRAEKAKLIKEGKIKKDKNESIIFRRDNSHYEKLNGVERCIDDEIPFEIPDSWEWCRIGTVFILQAGKNISSEEIKTEFTPGLFPCFGGNGIRGYVSRKNRTGSYALIGRQGALCGNINYAEGDFYATEHAVVVENFANCSAKWSGLFLQALNLNQYATSTAQPGLAVKNINTVLIPIPPLAEQKRIVEYCFLVILRANILTEFSL